MRHIGTFTATHNRGDFRLVARGFFACVAGACLCALPLRADEFSTIPANAPIYIYLNDLRQSTLTLGSDKSAASHSLTRYEAAIETARAILKVSTSRQAGSQRWSGSRSSLRALRKLTEALEPELTRLGINVGQTMLLLNDLISDGTADNADSATNSGTTATLSTARLGSGLTGKKVNLSQRLRVYSAVSSLARDADDPFGDSANFAARRAAPLARPGTLGAAANGSEAIRNDLPKESLTGGVQTGAALELTNWMQVRANFEQNQLTPGSAANDFRLRTPLLDGAREARSIGTGVDIALLNGVKFSGDVARLSALDSDGETEHSGTRFGGTLNMSAWQNRLSLSANLSRLVPEDDQFLASTAAKFNIGADVTRRMSLNFSYQQMFAAQGNDRLVSGGISVKF